MGDQIIQCFCRIGSPSKLGLRVYNLWKLQKSEKSTPESFWMLWNLMIGALFWSSKLFKLKYNRGDQIIQPFCRIRSHQEIRFLLFNLLKFLKSDKITSESWRAHWNLMNDEEFWPLKLLKLKYRRGEYSHSSELLPTKKLGAPSLICKNLESQGKVLLNHSKCFVT